MKELVLPAQTTKAACQVTRLRVFPGITQHVWFGFPAGCYGLAHVQVWDKGWQVWPWTPGESFHWENYVFDFDDRYPLTTEPYEFVIKAWNLDDSYEHKPFFAVTIEHLPRPEATADLEGVLSELGIWSP